jgi:dephospho-CoA kinase
MAQSPAIVGLTGGIGSGKSALASAMESLGVPVFYADAQAKRFYNYAENKAWLVQTFGNRVFLPDSSLNRTFLAGQIFSNPELKSVLESKIHPFVQGLFAVWIQDKSAVYVVREAAILIESGSYRDCQAVVVVEAPIEQRIQRVMQRDNLSRETVLQRIQAQMTDAQRKEFATFLIQNPDGNDLVKAAVDLHAQLLDYVKRA